MDETQYAIGDYVTCRGYDGQMHVGIIRSVTRVFGPGSDINGETGSQYGRDMYRVDFIDLQAFVISSNVEPLGISERFVHGQETAL